MIGLWVALLLLALFSSLFLVWPLLRQKRLAQQLAAQQQARQQANIDLYKQKLAQLDRDLAEGRIEAADYPEQQREIEDLLLDDAGDTINRPWQLLGQKQRLLGVCAVLLVSLAASWLLYARLGAAPGLDSYYAQQELIREGQKDFGSLLRRLEEAVEANPDDVQGWSLLARIYLDMGRLEAGADALEELLRLQGPNASLLAQQAQVLYFLDDNQITARVQERIDQALALNPEEPAVLSLLGMAAYQQQNWESALIHWEKALRHARSPEARESLREGVNDARQRLGMAPLDAEGPSFKVNLSLSQAAALKVNPEARVFVFARQPEGGGAPLAVTRLRVADLPARIHLSDRQAMRPENNLSSVQEVIIQARMALSGQPEAQPGDWQGTTDVLRVEGQQTIELEINRQLQ